MTGFTGNEDFWPSDEVTEEKIAELYPSAGAAMGRVSTRHLHFGFSPPNQARVHRFPSPPPTYKLFPQAEDEMPVPNPVVVRVDRYLDQGGDPFNMIKAASLVVRRDRDDVEAWLTLAAVVGLPDERDAHYWEAVRAGRNLWQRKRAAGTAPGWDDRETRLFAHALYDYGRSAGLDGRWDIALACVREMLQVRRPGRPPWRRGTRP